MYLRSVNLQSFNLEQAIKSLTTKKGNFRLAILNHEEQKSR